MPTRDLNQLIADNLKFFMQRPKSMYRNANALASIAKIAPNTVRNLLEPSKRTVTSTKPIGYPTLDKLAKIAAPLGCEVWELLHPDIRQSLREREMYRSIEKNLQHIKEAGDNGHHAPAGKARDEK